MKTVFLFLLLFLLSPITQSTKSKQNIPHPPSFVFVGWDRCFLCASSSSSSSTHSYIPIQSPTICNTNAASLFSFSSNFFLLFHFLFSSPSLSSYDHLLLHLLLCLCPSWEWEYIQTCEWIKWLHAVQINASAITQFKLFISLRSRRCCCLCCSEVFAVAVGLAACLLTTSPWSASHLQIHLSYPLALVSFHGLQAKPKPSPNTSNQSQPPSNPYNKQTLHSEYQRRTRKKKKCNEMPIGILIVVVELN